MKYKKLTLVFLVILFLFIFTNLCQASITVDYNGETIELPDLPIDTHEVYMHYVVCHNLYGYHLVFYESNDFSKFVISKSALNTLDSNGIAVTNGSVKLVTYDEESKTWGIERNWGDLSPKPDAIFYSNENVYNENGDVFFPQPPYQLGEIVEKAQMEQVLLQVVRILPLILVVVVSFLGLRKAWSLLSTLLHQA